jgi:CRISPR-associated protein Cas2
MMVLISYDVKVTSETGSKRLRRIAKECTNFGQRVQYSIFECILDPAQWALLKHTLESIIDPELDSLRYYYLGSHWQNKVEHVGAKPTLDFTRPIIV